MMNVAHFYHVYAAGQWQQIVAEHLDALQESGFDGRFTVGLVGNSSQRRRALEAVAARRRPDAVVEAPRGWEQVTLDAVHRYSKRNGGAVLYAHTKGAAHEVRPTVRLALAARNMSASETIWGAASADDYIRHLGGMSQQRVRQVMTEVLVHGWRESVEALERARSDVAGLYLHYHRRGFVGNFWIGTCAYLRKLPSCPRKRPQDAVSWISLREPRLLELPPPGSAYIESPCGTRTLPQLARGQARINGLLGGRTVPVCHLASRNPIAEQLERRLRESPASRRSDD